MEVLDKAVWSRVSFPFPWIVKSTRLTPYTALADAFINDRVSNGSEPFKVAWYQSDTTVSINYLKSDTVDVGITYNEAAEKIAIDQGIASSPSYYAFRDHFIIVGPPSNPANISNTSDILTIFSQLRNTAEAAKTSVPVRFLSRYDKSATNIKESALWIGIGQVSKQRNTLHLKTRDLAVLSGPMGNRLLNLVSPIHRLPDPGINRRDPPPRIHPHGSRHLSLAPDEPDEPVGHLQSLDR